MGWGCVCKCPACPEPTGPALAPAPCPPPPCPRSAPRSPAQRPPPSPAATPTPPARSGTLSPLDSFASELGTQFHVRLEAPHVVDMTRQVRVGGGPRKAQPGGRGVPWPRIACSTCTWVALWVALCIGARLALQCAQGGSPMHLLHLHHQPSERPGQGPARAGCSGIVALLTRMPWSRAGQLSQLCPPSPLARAACSCWRRNAAHGPTSLTTNTTRPGVGWRAALLPRGRPHLVHLQGEQHLGLPGRGRDRGAALLPGT